MPGILDINPEIGEQFVPTMRELLEAEVDANQNGEVPPDDGDFTEGILQDIDEVRNDNGVVEFDEYFDKYFVERIYNYLDGYDSTGKNINDLLIDFGDYLDSDTLIGNELDDEPGCWDSWSMLWEDISTTIDLEVSLSGFSVDATDIRWDIDFSLTFKEWFVIDLGASGRRARDLFPGRSAAGKADVLFH